ncbi:hypothetical protein T492DRAFT_840277 [Pavlovales sp. CCMP2436]|nr:hypothetical protein T492DRAFT_840277 [Pavlovales sp. CCMP2436]
MRVVDRGRAQLGLASKLLARANTPPYLLAVRAQLAPAASTLLVAHLDFAALPTTTYFAFFSGNRSQFLICAGGCIVSVHECMGVWVYEWLPGKDAMYECMGGLSAFPRVYTAARSMSEAARGH